jgi:hypothetical protein
VRILKAITAFTALAALAACSANAGSASADPLPLLRGVYLETGADCSTMSYEANPPPVEYFGDKFLSSVSGSSPVHLIAMAIQSATKTEGNTYAVAMHLLGAPANMGMQSTMTMTFTVTSDKEFAITSGDAKSYRWCADKIPA